MLFAIRRCRCREHLRRYLDTGLKSFSPTGPFFSTPTVFSPAPPPPPSPLVPTNFEDHHPILDLKLDVVVTIRFHDLCRTLVCLMFFFFFFLVSFPLLPPGHPPSLVGTNTTYRLSRCRSPRAARPRQGHLAAVRASSAQ